MSTKASFLPVVCVLVAAVVAAGCGSSEGADTAEGASGSGGDSLTVFAAASLTDAFEELGEEFTDQTGAEVTFSFAGSSTLATQIEQGAPADVFASADEAQMENVEEAGLVSGQPEVFTTNREVIVVPADNPGDVTDFADLANPGLRLVLAQEDVPAAEYAAEILDKAADNPEYGEDFKEDVKNNIGSREEDVRVAVNRVVVGDADGTFGYASDVTPGIRDEVLIVEIPEDLNITAEYPMAALSDSQNTDLSQRWIDFVSGEEGRSVMEKWGFQSVE